MKIVTLLVALATIVTVSLAIAQTGEEGVANFYSDKFQGKKTASGGVYDKNSLTASPKLAYGTKVKVTNVDNGRSWSRSTTAWTPRTPPSSTSPGAPRRSSGSCRAGRPRSSSKSRSNRCGASPRDSPRPRAQHGGRSAGVRPAPAHRSGGTTRLSHAHAEHDLDRIGRRTAGLRHGHGPRGGRLLRPLARQCPGRRGDAGRDHGRRHHDGGGDAGAVAAPALDARHRGRGRSGGPGAGRDGAAALEELGVHRGVGNPVLATGELVGSLALSALALLAPLLAAAIVVLVLVVSTRRLVRLLRERSRLKRVSG